MTPPIQFTAAADGTRIAYTVIPGKSPPWLHVYTLGSPTIELDFGIPARLGSITTLANGRAAVLYDHRGSGYSGPITGEPTLDHLTDDLEAVARAIGEPMDVAVFGTGCFAAMTYAARDPASVRTLLLSHPVLRFVGSFQHRNQAIWREGSYSGYLDVAGRTGMEVEPKEAAKVVRRWRELVPEETALAYNRAVLDVDLSATAAGLRVPTLVVSPPEVARMSAAVTALVPGARMVRIDFAFNRAELGVELRTIWEAHFPDLASRMPVNEEPPEAATLSAREREVVTLIAAGRTNAEIAATLGIAPATVGRHVQNILGKLGMHRRSEAAAWAAANGFVTRE